MKKANLFSLMIATLFIVNACGNAENSSSKDRKTEIKTITTYEISPDQSQASWVRQVDYKMLNKKVKIFGVYADVSMENVQLETNGTATINSGHIIFENKIPSSGEMLIDLSLTRFYSDDEESFFVNETYEPAKLTFKSFLNQEEIEHQYIAICDLKINDKTAEISFPVDFIFSESKLTGFTASYLMKTADWPILKQPKPENVNLDEINFGFDITFGEMSEKSDTIYLD